MKIFSLLLFFIGIAFSNCYSLEWIKGEPFTYITPPITKTTSEIMDISTPSENNSSDLPKYVHKREVKQSSNILANPMPSGSLEGNVTAPKAKKIGLIGAFSNGDHQTEVKLGPNFLATDNTGDIANLPDPSGSAGPTQYIVFCNSRVIMFKKESGDQDPILNINADFFFRFLLEQNEQVNFPKIEYDHDSNRWYLLAVSDSAAESNRFLLAVSREGIITDQTKWDFYDFAPGDMPPLWQVPTLGISKKALFIGASAVTFDAEGNPIIDSDAFVINKKKLEKKELDGTAFLNLISTDTDQRGPVFPTAADNFDENSKFGFFIGQAVQMVNQRDFYIPDFLDVRVVRNVETNPEISNFNPVTGTGFIFPIDVPQKDSDISLSNRAFLPSGANVRNHFLYYAQTTLLNNQGIADNLFPPLDRDGVRWFKISVKDPDNIPIPEMGTLYSRNPDINFAPFFWIPSIMTNGLNTMILGANSSGFNQFVNASFAMRFFTDTPGTIRDPISFKDSETPFTQTDGSWGEYTNMSLDPSDNMSFWSIQTIPVPIAPDFNWGLQVCRIKGPPPPDDLTFDICDTCICDEFKIAIHSHNDDEGRFFYDPGKGFEKHLRVKFSGGIKVKEVIYIDPSNIEVTISTRCAKPSWHSITIINPDDQEVTIEKAIKVCDSRVVAR